MRGIAWVTGGAGFIGSHLTACLQKNGWDVVVLDDKSIGSAANLCFLGVELPIVGCDLSDMLVLNSVSVPKPDVIFHLAGSANVPRSVEYPVIDFQANVVSTLNILEYARKNPGVRVVFPSTASVYKPGVTMPVKETDEIHASSPYGAAKIAGESYCFAYAASYGVDAVVVRLFNVYGPLMRRFVIHDTVRKLQKNPLELEIMGDGNQVREYLFVDDVAYGLELIAEKGKAGEAYNLGSGIPVRISDLASEIISVMGLDDVKLRLSMKSWPGDVKAWYADITKVEQLGFRPRTPWREGLESTIEFLSAFPDGITSTVTTPYDCLEALSANSKRR